MRRLLLGQLCVASLLIAFSASARADVFGSISLLSASPLQQADYSHDPAISGDGRYVVFDGSVGGVTGVWRRAVGSGEFEEVAGGDAQLPSVSQDGRYVSFTTNEGASLSVITDGLADPAHETGEAPNVYVRDMTKAPAETGAFTIVSAASGSTEPLIYGNSHPGSLFAREEYGSLAAGRTAMSADGREVVFVTTEVSNLARYPQLEIEEVERGETPKPHTPALQVAVRDLDTDTTRLVSVRYDPATGHPAINEQTGQTEPVPASGEANAPFGAVDAPGGPPIFTAPQAYSLNQHIGASISADGSTVAWMAQGLGQQVAGLPGETLNPEWAEPLWRRIGDGELAPTRRVTGGSDPANPACVASGERTLPSTASSSDPCQGPFATQETDNTAGVGGVWTGDTGDDIVPQLSADGYTVAFPANAPLVTLGGDFGGEATGRHSDLYIADMHEGLTRDEALRQLTELASGDEAALATNAPVTDFGISAQGTEIAFTTDRTVFPLGSLTYVSAPAVVPGMNELYDVDLTDNTLTRVTHGYEGGFSEHPYERSQTGVEDPYFFHFGIDDGALSPSFTTDGDTIAFSSTASNLVFGDNNTPSTFERRGALDGGDAFAVGRIIFGEEPAETAISPAPPGPAPAAPWQLGVTALSLANGTVRLYVELPGPGLLRAQASSSVLIRSTRSARAHNSRRRSRAIETVALRTVASTKKTVGTASSIPVTLVLTLARGYQSLASRRGGLSATATITFAAGGHPTLKSKLVLSFVKKATRRRSHAASAPRKAKGVG
jgi:hypothetical protein